MIVLGVVLGFIGAILFAVGLWIKIDGMMQAGVALIAFAILFEAIGSKGSN